MIAQNVEHNCIKELEENKLDLFSYLLENEYYILEVYIDNETECIIQNCSHDVKILFINNIKKTIDEVERIDLIRVSENTYNLFYEYCDPDFEYNIERGSKRLINEKIKININKIKNLIKKNYSFYFYDNIKKIFFWFSLLVFLFFNISYLFKSYID